MCRERKNSCTYFIMGRILCRHYKNPIKNIGIEPEKSWFFVHIIQIMPLHFVVIYGMMKKDC